MQKIKRIAINGKTFCWPLTGLRRVAEELVMEIDNILSSDETLRQKLAFEIIAPSNAKVGLNLNNIFISQKGALEKGYFTTLPWEQVLLPFSLKKNQTLLSLCNLSPILFKNSIVMIHDAQMFITPESFNLQVRLWQQTIFKILGWRAKKILTVSEYSKSQLIKYGVAKTEKITVIHNGCDHVLREVADFSVIEKHHITNTHFFLAQSNSIHYKNIAVILKAFSSNQLKDVTLVLYGSATKEDFEAQGNIVPSNVLFTGRVSDSELVALMLRASATLTPSTTEGFGLQPLEGMILGCPAIVSPCGALPEVCGYAALYAAPDNPKEWVDKISFLIEKPKIAAELKARGKLQAQQFTWNSAAKKLLSHLT